MAIHRIRHTRPSSLCSASLVSSLAAWLCARRVFASRFAVAVASVFASKFVHVYAHREALATPDVLAYGLSFAQDVLFLRLFDAQASLAWRPLKFLAAGLASAIVALSLLAATSISFLVAGTELHWRNAGVAGDSSSWAMLLSGLFCSLVVASILVAAWFLQEPCFVITNAALAIVHWHFSFLFPRLSARWRPQRNVTYHHIPQNDVENGLPEQKHIDQASCGPEDQHVHSKPAQSKAFTWFHVIFGVSAHP